MNFDYFFTPEYKILEDQVDIGFDLYGPGHLIWLLALTIVIILFSGHYKKIDQPRRNRIKRIFAVAMVIAEIYKDIIIIVGGADIIEYLPLHLCGLAIFGICIDAFWGKSDMIKQMVPFAFVPGAAAALLFCNWTNYPFLNFMCIHSFVFHGSIVLYFVMQYRAGEVKFSYKGMWQSCLTLFAAAIPMFIFNNFMGTNYLFINEASEGSPLVPLWNIFGTRFGMPGYLISYAVLAIVVLHGMYLLYKVLDKVFKKNQR